MSLTHIDSHYARTSGEPPVRPALEETLQAEVCVIGGGLAGLATALGLAERGKSVVLLEARRAGWGASGRNGGFVAQGFSLNAADLAAKLGKDHARALYALSREATATIRSRIETYDIDCDPVFEGYLKAAWRSRPGTLEVKREFLTGVLNTRDEYWPREQVREVLRSSRYHDALFDPDGFHIHPLNFTNGIAAAAESKGAQIFEDSAVTSVARQGNRWNVSTAAGAIEAETVVVCTGGYTEHLVSRLRSAIVPAATFVMVTKPLGAALASTIRTQAAVSDSRRAGNYYRVLPGGRLLWGGGMTALTREPDALADRMCRDLKRVYPQLTDVEPDTAWSGLMGYARHQMPQIGELEPGLWHATAFGGHGLNTTTMAGELVAGAIAGGDDRYRLFAPFGLAWTGGPLIGSAAAEVTYAWYKLRDRIN